MKNTLFLISFIVFIITSCETNNPEQNILMFREGDGIYQLNLSINEEKCILKDSNLVNFSRSDGKPDLNKNILTFETSREYTPKSKKNKVAEGISKYHSIDFKYGAYWFSKKISYQIDEDKEEKRIRTEEFSIHGDTIQITDTVIPYNNKPILSTINGISSYIFDKQNKSDKSVFFF